MARETGTAHNMRGEGLSGAQSGSGCIKHGFGGSGSAKPIEFVLARDKLLAHAIHWPSSIGCSKVSVPLQPLSNLVQALL
jgi:hypothetical protein